MNDNILSLNEVSAILEEVLSSGGTVTLMSSGRSMEPFISDGRDRLTLIRADDYKQGDVVLYKSKTGKTVLHRIITEENGTYVLRGDSQHYCEENVKKDDISAVLVSIERNGKTYGKDSFYFKKYKKLLPLIRLGQKIKYKLSVTGENK